MNLHFPLKTSVDPVFAGLAFQPPLPFSGPLTGRMVWASARA
ncbi:hypothetical protein [Larkinella ripae]